MFDEILYIVRHYFPMAFYKVTTREITVEEFYEMSVWIWDNNIKGQSKNIRNGDEISGEEIWRAMHPDESYTYEFEFWHPEDAMAFKLKWS